LHDKVAVFVAGVQKGGTTSLFHYLSEHPDLHAPTVKEIHFFDDEETDWSAPDYGKIDACFRGRTQGRLRFEATPIYAFWPRALERIADYNPAARLILLFRDPFERAVSHWAMEHARGFETLSFSEAIRTGRDRLRGVPDTAPAWRLFSYLERGLYGEQIARARAIFPPSRLLFLRSADLRDRPALVLDEISRFLDIGPFPDTAPRIEHRRRPTPGMPPPTDEDLALVADFVRDDLVAFQAASGLDLSDWPTFRRLAAPQEGRARRSRWR